MDEPSGTSDALTTDLLSDQVHRRLRVAILHRELAPGKRLVEAEIARQYGVSQAPVRDALRRLAHEGLVTYVKRRGTYVSASSSEEAEKAHQVRLVLEELAARLCAGRLSAEAIDALQQDIESMRSAASSGDPVRQRECDIAFHRHVCQFSGNPFILKTWDVLEPSLYRLFAIADPFAELDLDTMVEMHQELLSALVAGSPETAAAAFVDHSSRSTEVVSKL